MMPSRIELTRGWTFQTLTPDTPLSGQVLPASVPGTVQLDLLRHGLIPDPYFGENEREVQWVGEARWIYRLDFKLDAELLAAPHLDLCLDGLDTFCTARLNGEVVLESDNMFLAHRLSVKGLLGRHNTLELTFDPALQRGQDLERIHGPAQAWNGDPSRVYVRKAQYHYGWDWGPTILTAGPWKGVSIEAYQARIAEVHCPVTLNDDLTRASLGVQVELEGQADEPPTIHLFGPDGALIGEQTGSATFDIPSPRLWWPAGQGEQPLYTVEAVLSHQRVVRRIGLRQIRLLQEPVEGEPGASFTFEVNGRELFCGGANWIPEDLLLNRVTPEQYKTRVQQAVDAHMNMLRVWGGGLYEQGAFYDACDELGVLVWQDFMFACGLYPAHTAFSDSVRREAEQAVTRLRHHPCLALWCGNNEDYQVAESVGVYGPGVSRDHFPALAIYEDVLPEVVSRLSPELPYWPGSPYAGVTTADGTVGDRHVWDVWHGAMAPYTRYADYAGRFVSEFGMQAYPNARTFRDSLPTDEQFPLSRSADHHNKATDGPRRMAVYLSDTLAAPDDLDGYTYATQLTQAEALTCAYRAFRRRWGTARRRGVSGALVWQLNDCWPAVSWALVDSGGRPKAAYYAVRRELAPLALGLERQGRQVEVWVNSSLEHRRPMRLVLEGFLPDGTTVEPQELEITASPNSCSEVGAFSFPPEAAIFARLLAQEQEIARASDFPQPFKHHRRPDPGLSVTVLDPQRVAVRSERATHGVWLEAENGASFAENFLDFLPGEERHIQATVPLQGSVIVHAPHARPLLTTNAAESGPSS